MFSKSLTLQSYSMAYAYTVLMTETISTTHCNLTAYTPHFLQESDDASCQDSL